MRSFADAIAEGDLTPLEPVPPADIERFAVESKLLKSLGYDPTTKTLHVEFQRGSVYAYHDVAADTYHALLNAESIGGHFLRHVKDAHRFTRIEK